MLKCFNASTIALSLSSGHCGCLLSSFLGKLGLGTSSKSVAAVVELPCKQSILLVATRKFFATSIPHFLFTCEIYPAFVSVGTKEQPSQREQSDKIDQRSRLFPAYILPPEMPEDLLPGWSLCRKYIQYGLPHKKESSAMLWDGFHPLADPE